MNSSGLAVWQSQQPQMARKGSLMTVFMKSEGKLYAQKMGWKNCRDARLRETDC